MTDLVRRGWARASTFSIVALSGASIYLYTVDRRLVAYTAGGIALVTSAAYLCAIFWGETRPHRITWTVWAFIGVLGFSSALSGGAGPASAVPGIYAAVQIAVAACSWTRYGKPGSERGRRWTPVYWALAAAAVAMLVVWKTAQLPTYAGAGLAVLADAFVIWPTVQESWDRPETEPSLIWAADVLATGFALSAIATYSFSSAAYTAYLVAASALVAGTLLIQSRRARRTMFSLAVGVAARPRGAR